jgi:hypothetical protein
MLQVILAKSQDVSLVDEMQFKTRAWLHRDLLTDIRRHVGPLDDPGALDRLMDLLYSGIPEGWIWSEAERMLDRDMLRAELAKEPLTEKSIFDAIMTTFARMRGERGTGAKFPVHYSYTQLLLDWYPDCRLIHTTRNPKAVYASQAAKYVTPGQNRLARAYLRFKQFAHINIQTSWTAHIHRKYCDLPNYLLVRYEDMVLNSEHEIRRICEFLEIEFVEEMLQPKQFGSSYNHIGQDRRGIDTSSLERWRTSISRSAAGFMDLVHRRAMQTLGYKEDKR